jgi:hypothetical protein
MRDPQQMILRAIHEYAIMSIMKYALSDTTPVSIDGTNPQYNTASESKNTGMNLNILSPHLLKQLLVMIVDTDMKIPSNAMYFGSMLLITSNLIFG